MIKYVFITKYNVKIIISLKKVAKMNHLKHKARVTTPIESLA